MSIADEIIYGQLPNIDKHLQQGEALDDIDEYGFTALIECAIVGNFDAAQLLLEHNVEVDKTDVTGRTALHWAVDNKNISLTKLLLSKGANPNSFNRGGQSVLVYPLLREHWLIKQTLYESGASLDFALDFINAKLIGHRFELSGDVDIVTSNGEYIELDYEGFILEFSIDVIRHSLGRFRNNFAARRLRQHFNHICEVLYGFETAADLLKYQYLRLEPLELDKRLEPLISQMVLILPVAYRGHAVSFVQVGKFWAKIDRGENSLKEGTVNVYHIGAPQEISVRFIKRLVFQKQTENYVHQQINDTLQLKPLFSLPLSSQITGNCSWANIEAIVPTALFMLKLENSHEFARDQVEQAMLDSLDFYKKWLTWDKDRNLDECIQGFRDISKARQASRVSILGAILFQSCNFGNEIHIVRAEKILKILMLPEFHYVLRSYLQAYCINQLTPRGNNLLKFLEDAGIDAELGIQAIATSVKDKKSDT